MSNENETVTETTNTTEQVQTESTTTTTTTTTTSTEKSLTWTKVGLCGFTILLFYWPLSDWAMYSNYTLDCLAAIVMFPAVFGAFTLIRPKFLGTKRWEYSILACTYLHIPTCVLFWAHCIQFFILESDDEIMAGVAIVNIIITALIFWWYNRKRRGWITKLVEAATE